MWLPLIDNAVVSSTIGQVVVPWFDGGLFGAILGAMIGIYGGAYGTVCGLCASKGKAKNLVYTLHYGGVIAGVTLLLFGVVAYFSGQPYSVWYGLGLSGLILVFVIGCLTPMLHMRYRQAEHRKLEAHGFREG
jgi:uncharacterized membrane protein